MNKAIVFLCLFGLLGLPACAKKNVAENQDMAPNLDPELSVDFLKIRRPRPLTEQEKKALASQTDIPFHLDVKDNDEVEMFLTYFTQEKRDTMERWLERASPQLPYIRAVLATYKLPVDLIALPFIESGYNTMAYSPAGAGGMWQFMPATGRRYGLNIDWWEDERRNPYLSTVAAAKYLGDLYVMFNDWNLALASYNCGENKMCRVMAQTGQSDFFDIAKNPGLLKDETRHYVPKFLAVLKIFKNLEALGFKPVDWTAGQVIEEVKVPAGTDLASLAESCNMGWDDFYRLNSAFRRQVSPPDRESQVYLPKDKKELALAYLADPSRVPNRGLRQYAAAGGDTWWNVSKHTGVPVNMLRQINPGLGETLEPGQTVYVPLDASAQDTALADLDERPAKAAEVHQAISHKVRRGESLADIAKHYGVTKAEILKANNLKSERQVVHDKNLSIPVRQPAVAAVSPAKPGQPVQAAAAQVKTVEFKKGESLKALAQAFKVDPKVLLAANGLKSEKELKPGRKLIVPTPVQPESQAAPAKEQRLAAREAKETKEAKHQEKPVQPAKAEPAQAKAQASQFKNQAVAAKETKSQDKPTQIQPAQAKEQVQAAGAKKPVQAMQHYNVGNGETVWSIARKFKVDPQSLLAWNNLDKSVQLRPGDHLKIYAQ